MKLMNFTCIFVITFSANAFNWRKCNNYIKRYSYGFNPAGVFMSSTSFTTSTGDCAMIGEVQHDKKVFLALNKNEIMFDAANGGGRYLDQYAKMNNCFVGRYRRSIHNNYSVIFQNDSSEEAFKKLEKYSCLKPNG